MKAQGNTTKGMQRELNKQVYGSHQRFFEFVLIHWAEKHVTEINRFYNDINKLFRKVSEFHDISPKEWQIDKKTN